MKIFYISDLHFDYNGKESLEKFLGLLNENDIFIILGDFYNDITKTLVIIDLLEHKKVKGY
jgi:predicted phosphodiesterase